MERRGFSRPGNHRDERGEATGEQRHALNFLGANRSADLRLGHLDKRCRAGDRHVLGESGQAQVEVNCYRRCDSQRHAFPPERREPRQFRGDGIDARLEAWNAVQAFTVGGRDARDGRPGIGGGDRDARDHGLSLIENASVDCACCLWERPTGGHQQRSDNYADPEREMTSSQLHIASFTSDGQTLSD